MDATVRRMAAAAALAAGIAGAVLVTTGTSAGADGVQARAVLRNAAGTEIGEVEFKGRRGMVSEIEVEVDLPADAPGLGAYHGFHIHTTGACTAPFTSAGGHWNVAAGATHGSHTGDMPSVLVAPDGTGSAEFRTHRFNVTQLFDADGSAVILHLGPDNFGNVPLAANRYQDATNWYNAIGGTAATGDAGGRYACGLVTSGDDDGGDDDDD